MNLGFCYEFTGFTFDVKSRDLFRWKWKERRCSGGLTPHNTDTGWQQWVTDYSTYQFFKSDGFPTFLPYLTVEKLSENIIKIYWTKTINNPKKEIGQWWWTSTRIKFKFSRFTSKKAFPSFYSNWGFWIWVTDGTETPIGKNKSKLSNCRPVKGWGSTDHFDHDQSSSSIIDGLNITLSTFHIHSVIALCSII